MPRRARSGHPRFRRPMRTLIGLAVVVTLAIAGNQLAPSAALAVTGTGPITGIGGKCVDVAGANSANGTQVQIYTCNGTAAQQWVVGADGTIRALGKCLDVAAAGTANGTKVQIYDCNGTDAQNCVPHSSTALVNTGSGKCLDATGHSKADGTALQIWTCSGNANQQWVLPDATAGFVHPGVLVSRAQLDFVRGKVQAGAQPWTNAYNADAGQPIRVVVAYARAPRSIVDAAPYSDPNYGCTDEREDAIAAYTDALAWYISGNAPVAQKAIQLMDAWSASDHRPHELQRAAASGLGGLGVAARRRDHQIHVRLVGPTPPGSPTMLRNVYLPEVT